MQNTKQVADEPRQKQWLQRIHCWYRSYFSGETLTPKTSLSDPRENKRSEPHTTDIHPQQLAEDGCLFFYSSFCKYTMSTSLTPLS